MTLVCTYPLCNSSEVYRNIHEAIRVLAPGAAVRSTSTFSFGSSQWVTTIDGLREDEELVIKLRLVDQCISVEWPKDR